MRLRLSLLPLALAACTESAPSTPPAAADEAPPAEVDKGTTPEARNQVDPDGTVRRGQTLSEGPAMTVAEVYAKAEAFEGQTIKVQGQVEKACSKKGCWMTLEGTDAEHPPIRVTALGYGFFVPEGAPGMAATIEGEFKVKTLSVEEAQHYENDRVAGTDEAPRQIEAPMLEGALVAKGLELK